MSMIKVALEVNPDYPMPDFKDSNFVKLDPECKDSFYTFTNDPYSKTENTILISDQHTESTSSIIMSSKAPEDDNYSNWDWMRYYKVGSLYPIKSIDPVRKSNFIVSLCDYSNRDIVDYLISHDIPFTTFKEISDVIKSCYAICDNIAAVGLAISYRCIPIITFEMDKDIPLFRYEGTPETVHEIIKDLSPKSYLMESEKVLSNISSLFYISNPLDYLFANYAEYFMKRKTIELTMDQLLNGMAQ